ncbi:MAG: phosphoglucosamine mutase [Crocinitomicaceae bacterium]|nr:phosphoglucosamine mutase [Crocinitomicaceae bacterium]
MTLIKSISGIRGTIGGKPGENLTPLDTVKFASAFATLIQKRTGKQRVCIVVGRDARLSGEMMQQLVMSTFVGMGVHVIDVGLSTTPTIEVAVPAEKADAGIILTASHNPKQWNALKLLNDQGEFISAADGAEVLEMVEKENFSFATVDTLGIIEKKNYLTYHLDKILSLPLVNKSLIANAKLRIAVDAVCSSGGVYVPALLKMLGITDVELLYCEPTGNFPHNPEPLAEHLNEISSLVREKKCHLGIVVDPDVDRLAFVCEDGSMFGEEYTLVAVADYILKHTPGNTVSNLSSTRALKDVTEGYGLRYEAAAVGEVNVVEKMKEINAVIGGEGNGGIIYPELHYGRDALVGIALFLTHYVKSGKSMSAMRDGYPQYAMSKNKIELQPGMDVDAVLKAVEKKFSREKINTIDGVKIDFPCEWVHLRKSNTEPIIRIYTESSTRDAADALAERIINEIQQFV